MNDCVHMQVINNHSNLNTASIICFEPLKDSLALPYPLYLGYHWNVLFALLFLLTLIQGTKLRLIIFSYINSPEAKTGPINKLFWMDQIYGIFMGVSLVARIAFILCPYPLGFIFGFIFTSI